MKFECPHCQQSIEADDEWAGLTANCPTCNGSFVVQLDIAVTTTQEVADGKAPVVYVTRDKLGLQFLDAKETGGRKTVAIAKADLLQLDPSLAEVFNLPIGWHAWRESADAPWEQEPLPEKKAPQDVQLSPEAEKFLAEAWFEYDIKQAALERDWRFDSSSGWGFDQDTGIFTLDFADGSQLQASGQILGCYSAENESWEWAWDNPDCKETISGDSRMVRELGERVVIPYLLEGVISAPGRKLVTYLCAIGLKATGSVGVFEGEAGPVTVFLMLKDLKWTESLS